MIGGIYFGQTYFGGAGGSLGARLLGVLSTRFLMLARRVLQVVTQ